MKNLLEFITFGAEVRRYHTLTTLQTETVGHHSHGVALLCGVLEPHAHARLLMAALVHDLAEQVTGDIPSPAKRELGIGNDLHELEETLLRKAGFPQPVLGPSELRTLKLADLAQGALTCVRELQLGNSRMRIVLDRYVSYAESMNLQGREAELFNTIKGMAV